ncbi:YkgJ family cysteine cluster protein [Treponema sp. HNW]|uniref:YkgJ family cysteine cluster protein n=1 Tax=Treponema sp. HNW TaxID=3116654 RepID=UPI003D0BCC87
MKEAQAFTGTKMFDALNAVDAVYNDIDKSQALWKQKTPAPCPDGCGRCCEHFEPDVYEYEALYLAAWLLVHEEKLAEDIRLHGADFSLNHTDGCLLFDPYNPYHCRAYGGRCLICRLFAHSGTRGKDMKMRWKPCKFIEGAGQNREHREYGEAELTELFGFLPPDMAQAAARLMALNPENTETRPLREELPCAIEKLKLILRFLTPPEPNSPEPDLPSPHPLSA